MIERALKHVRDLKKGRDYLASEFFAQPEGETFKARRSCVEGRLANTSALVCSLCNQPVYIAGTPQREFIFKHFKERGDCPIKTAGRYSQAELDRIRYAGQRESELHKALKREIGDALIADSTRCANVRIEGVRRSSADPRAWRRPDVSCEFLGKKVVFEIQLSTTYLNVIVEREVHYREDQTFIVWLFSDFDPESLKFIHKDILYSNQDCLFVFDEEARRRSLAEQKLVVHCYQLLNPAQASSGRWTNDFVELENLVFDEESFLAYLPSLAKGKLAMELEAYWPTRQKLEIYERSEQDKLYAKRFEGLGVKFDTWRLPRLLDSLYSLKSKSIIGYAYKPFKTGLVQIGHNLFDNRKEFFITYLRAMNFYGLRNMAKAADREEKLFKRVKEVRSSRSDGRYRFPSEHREIIDLLFPELAQVIER